MTRSLRFMIAPIALLLVCAATAGAAPDRPRLIVLISIDQFRADFQTRFYDLYLPPDSKEGVGGFRWLMESGAYFVDAHHDHFPLFTGPGHSIHLTGAPPYKSGIVGNWWFDRDLNDRRYCVGDKKSPLVGVADAEGKRGMSPETLRVSTVGDELKMATGGHAKVWALGLKDRAAILMAGRLADGVLWFDEATSYWISSRFYRKDDTLHPWVSTWNQKKHVDDYFGKMWELSVAPEALKRLWTPDNEFTSPRYGLGKSFPHPIHGELKQPGQAFYQAFTYSPYGNEYVLRTAEEIVTQESLGKDDIPDILAINLSSNDYIGHTFGPDSAEVLDVSVQTDRQLSGFFRFLNESVPGGLENVTILLTADHGVAPISEAMRKAGFTAGVYPEKDLETAVEKALDDALGRGDWSKRFEEANYYLNLDELKDRRVARERAEEIAADALRAQPGIYSAYTRSQILDGRMPDNDIAKRVTLGFHPKVSGDVVIVSDPFWTPTYTTGATHGAPYAYDTAVPLLLAGYGIKPGRYTQRASTLDIAPTLSALLGILAPSGCEGHVLSEALK